MTRIAIQHMRDSLSHRLLGNEIANVKTDDHRPTTSYLKLLDLYGLDNDKNVDETTADDWVEFVDRHSRESQDMVLP